MEKGAQAGDVLIGNPGRVDTFRTSADGRGGVSWSWNENAQVWDVDTEAHDKNALSGHMDRVRTVAMSAQ